MAQAAAAPATNAPKASTESKPTTNAAASCHVGLSRPDGGPLNDDALNHAANARYKRAGVTRPPMPVHCLRRTFVDVGEADKRAAIAAVFGLCSGGAVGFRGLR